MAGEALLTGEKVEAETDGRRKRRGSCQVKSKKSKRMGCGRAEARGCIEKVGALGLALHISAPSNAPFCPLERDRHG